MEFFVEVGAIRGKCRCITPTFEVAQYDLKVEVTGRGFILLDGVRNADDGAEDIFRAILQHYSDTRTQTMNGGFAMYWPPHREIFVGHLALIKIIAP